MRVREDHRGLSRVQRLVSSAHSYVDRWQLAAVGECRANIVLMRDDGKEGDERAGDGVWSYEASFAAGARLEMRLSKGDDERL
jgi:hypothetical protein